MTTQAGLDTWFVVHEGLVEGAENFDTNPLAGHLVFEKEITDAFDETIRKGYASKDRGLYLTKLTDVSLAQAEKLSDDLEAIVASDFKGFNAETLKSWKSDLSDWNDESLDEITETVEPDVDGFHRY